MPVLGICYGMQAMARSWAARSSRARTGSTGGPRSPSRAGRLFEGVRPTPRPRHVTVWMSHGDTVLVRPRDSDRSRPRPTARWPRWSPRERQLYAVQFHPEVAHTPQGQQVLENFLFHLAGLAGLVDELVRRAGRRTVRATVGRERCPVRALRAASTRRSPPRWSTGRSATSSSASSWTTGSSGKGKGSCRRTFRDRFGMRLLVRRRGARFLERLRGVTDPEQKRKLIGAEFIAVFQEEAERLGTIPFLAQGTLYPDVIESTLVPRPVGDDQDAPQRGRPAGGPPVQAGGAAARAVQGRGPRPGRSCSASREIVWRQPFPGPGLAVRILGEVTAERLAVVRDADEIVLEEIEAAGLGRRVWQAFAVLLPVRTVGVMGDFRTYAQVVALRAVESQDAMTADWARLPYDVLARISTRIINEVKGVNRVVYDISSEPPRAQEGGGRPGARGRGSPGWAAWSSRGGAWRGARRPGAAPGGGSAGVRGAAPPPLIVLGPGVRVTILIFSPSSASSRPATSA